MLAGINLLFNPSIAFIELKTQSQYRIHPRIKFTKRFTLFLEQALTNQLLNNVRSRTTILHYLFVNIHPY